MRSKPDQILKLLLFTLLGFFSIDGLQGQQKYKFPIIQEGVYKISSSQATSLGMENLDQVRVYGWGGMLPQLLDSSSFFLTEVPVKKIDDALYFFLSGPHHLSPNFKDGHFAQNRYTDTLYYVLAYGSGSENIVMDAAHEPIPSPNLEVPGALYKMQYYFLEENNILSSGRNWYGFRVFNRREELIPFETPSDFTGNEIWTTATFMAQSPSESRIDVKIQQEVAGSINIGSIPNTRYGIKGRENQFTTFVNISSSENQLDWRFSFETQDPNGMGFLKHALVGFPYVSNDLPSGVFYQLDENALLVNTTQRMIWDVSDFHQVQDLTAIKPFPSGSKKLAVFDPQETPEILGIEPINQSLFQTNEDPEFLIITSRMLWQQARRLAEFKNSKGMATQAVLLEDIYDAFGYGNPDITAIRNFLAYQFHYGNNLKNVLFLGKGTFDYKQKLGGRPNLVPTYSSVSSLNPLTTYGSDDYFGFLQLGEGEWEESESGDHLLDIGIGRIPAITNQEASIAVDKIIQYQQLEKTSGDWKSRMLFIADDGDNNIHLRDAESHSQYLHKNHPEMALHKLYLDSYEQVANGSAQSSPKAKAALNRYLEDGVLLVNFIGHGNEVTLTAEEIFTVNDIRDWPETDRLPVFITATCEFGRHDSPFIRSGAEELLFAERKGAIALLTTGRPVFSSINFSLNKAFVEAVFKNDNGYGLTLGEIFKITKNNSLNGPLNRNFSLLGDPSLKLNLPELLAEAEQFIDIEMEVEEDTLRAFQKIHYKGQIKDPISSALMNQFSGPYKFSLNGQPLVVETLGDEGPSTNYLEYNNILFRGKGEVINGEFEGVFLLGKHTSGEPGNGLVRVFAQDLQNSREAFGGRPLQVGGAAPNKLQDNTGPDIRFSFGDSLQSASKVAATQTPIWIFLKDESGINITPNQEGQDISLIINDHPPLSLNDQYHALNQGYKEGYIKGLLQGLKEGNNTITVRVFDNLGNWSEKTEILEVSGSLKLRITEVKNFPNPSTTATQFKISHNRPGENINLALRVFSLLGNEIFSLQRRFPRADATLGAVHWIFLDRKTNYPVKGTYLYELELFSEEDGSSERKGGKLIIQ